jgi:hypothetical protein
MVKEYENKRYEIESIEIDYKRADIKIKCRDKYEIEILNDKTENDWELWRIFEKGTLDSHFVMRITKKGDYVLDHKNRLRYYQRKL